MSRMKRVLFSAIILAGLLGFAEVAASLFYYFGLPEQKRAPIEASLGLKSSDSNSVLGFVPHPYFNYLSNPEYRFANGYKPHNAMGLRNSACCAGPKKPGQVRIVAVGGSTTYGISFSNERNVWPALLENELRKEFGPGIEVINAGVPNYTTYEILGLVAMRVPEIEPDLVLIHVALNDAFTVGYPDEGGPDNGHFRHAWSYRPLPEWLRWGMRTSHIVRLIGLLVASQEGFLPGDMAGAIQYAVPSDPEVIRNVQAATGKYFRRNLRSLVALCQSMGSIPVLINTPVNPTYETGQGVYYDAVVKAVIRNNRILKELADVDGLVYIDLYSQMRDPGIYVDAGHVNQAGMRMTATHIAPHLIPVITDLVKRKPR